MPDPWTGELLGKMHNAGVTSRELADKLGYSRGYVSMLFNSKCGKRSKQEELERAFAEILEERKKKDDYQNRTERHPRSQG